MTSICNWLYLPKDIKIKILFFLSHNEILRISSIPLSKEVNKLFSPYNYFWIRLIYKQFKIGISSSEINSGFYSQNLKHEYNMFRIYNFFPEKSKNFPFENLKYITTYSCRENINVKLISMTNLKHLLLYRVDTKSLNAIFKMLTKLESLHIHETNICIDSMKYLTGLKYLSCDKLTNCHLTCLKNLKNILLMGNEKITIDGLKLLPKLTILTILNNSKIFDEDFSQLNLKSLRLYHNKNITENAFKHLRNLMSLDLTYCNITDKALKNLEKLNYLKLSHCKYITIEGIQNLKYLKKLKLLGNIIPNDELFKLSKLPCLKTLSINRLTCTTEDLKLLINLKYIEITNCQNIDDTLFEHLINLETLNIYISFKKNKITIDGLVKCKEMSNLNTLILRTGYTNTKKGRIKNIFPLDVDEIKQRLKGLCDIKIL